MKRKEENASGKRPGGFGVVDTERTERLRDAVRSVDVMGVSKCSTPMRRSGRPADICIGDRVDGAWQRWGCEFAFITLARPERRGRG